MNSFKLFGLLLVTSIMGMAFSVAPTLTTYKVDPAKSTVLWKGYKVTGSHEGTIGLTDGNLEYTDDQLTGGTFQIDMTSINCTDLDGKGKGKLEGHLKSADFFDVANFPNATFKITKVVSRGMAGDYKIVGELTIKDTTKEVKFLTKVTDDGAGKTAVASTTIDRSDFNVRYGSGSFFDNLGDRTIYDDFDLTINLVLSK